MPRTGRTAAEAASFTGTLRSMVVIEGGAPARIPSTFLRAVADGVAAGVAVPALPGVPVVVGVIGPGVGGVVGALALGAANDETTRMAITSRAVRTTTVTAAR